MSTERKIYLNHITRYKARLYEMSEILTDEKRKHNQIIWKMESTILDQRKMLHEIAGPVPVEPNFRRRGDNFYFVIGEKEIRLNEYGLSKEFLDLSLNEIIAIKAKKDELLEQMELFAACPKREHELDNCDFSKREFIKVLSWWGLFEDEKENLNHLFSFKYDYEYRKKILAERKAEKEAGKKTNSPRKTYVYLMKDEQTGFHKIGQSKNPAVRESTLFSEKPSIILICAWLTDGADETLLHNKYTEKRVRGEWFNLGDPEITEIHEYFADRETWSN